MLKTFGLLFIFAISILLPAFNISAQVLSSSSVVISEVQTGGCLQWKTVEATICEIEDGKQEFIELHNASEDTEISLSGWRLEYLSAGHSGNLQVAPTRTLATFDGVIITGGYVLVSYVNYMQNADIFFGQSSTAASGLLAKSGGHVRLVDDAGIVMDQIGWGSANQIQSWPKTSEISAGYSVKRILPDNPLYAAGEIFSTPTLPIDPVTGGYIPNEEIEEQPIESNNCEGIIISEVLPNPAGADAGKEFIELHNPASESILLEGCGLETTANSKSYVLDQQNLAPGQYRAFYNDETGLTLANSAGGTVYLINTNDAEISTVEYPGGLGDDASWSLFSSGFAETFMLTPNDVNELIKFKPCPEGQLRNLETNRCNIITATTGLAPCAPGKTRNPETNRCRNLASLSSVLKACAPDQFRNPQTNRCKKSASDAGLKPCAADQIRNPKTNRCKKSTSGSGLKPCAKGKERNPQTNRCRNVASILNTSGQKPVQDIPASTAGKQGLFLAVGGIIGALFYGLWEWRNEAILAFSNLKKKLL
ncbi:lamin tail domain-containing protein [Candidatus Parcubacteria bacterium]|nr:lamin tail domain-containing protein [Candidatus Parcubacteria bacterium]